MYSIYLSILVSIFGSSIYCQSCSNNKTNCLISTICCVNLEIPESMPRTGGLIRIFNNFSVDTDIESRTYDYNLLFESDISVFYKHTKSAFECNNIKIYESSWTCVIVKVNDNRQVETELIENLYLIDNVKCCRSKLILSSFSKIYVRDPGISFAPDYIFKGHTGYFDFQFTYCPNKYFTDYTEFTLDDIKVTSELQKEPFIGQLCTFRVKLFGILNKDSLSLIIKINNQPLPKEIIIKNQEKPYFQDYEWTTFQQLSDKLTIRGNHFSSLYKPHYQLEQSVGYSDHRQVYKTFSTLCHIISNILMVCDPLTIENELPPEIYKLQIISHEEKITGTHNLRIKYLPAPVIKSAWLSNKTDKILKIKYAHIDKSYSPLFVEVVHIKRNEYLKKIECIDVIVKYDQNQLTCSLNGKIEGKFRWWVEMTIGNYKLKRYCLVGCNLWLSDWLTFILYAVLIVLISLCLYVYFKFKAKRQASHKNKSKLSEDTLSHPMSNPMSKLIFLCNRRSKDVVKSLHLTRSEVNQLIQNRLRERAEKRISSGIDPDLIKGT